MTVRSMRWLLSPIFLCAILISANPAYAQSAEQSVYGYRYAIDIPTTLFGIGFNFWGQEQLRQYPHLAPEDYANLGPDNINAFDRGATRQDPTKANAAHGLSNVTLFAAPLLPFALGFDRKIRKDGLNLSLMYLQTHSFNTIAYLVTALNIRRKRPFVYNPREITERKGGQKSTDSFFSGHVSVVTASTFYMAKVYLDYHPEKRHKKWLYYGLATIPSAYTAYFRYTAGKHFPSDMIVGYVIGAAIGILTPEMHQSKFYKRAQIYPSADNDAGKINIIYSFY